jgi:hypothetical protein
MGLRANSQIVQDPANLMVFLGRSCTLHDCKFSLYLSTKQLRYMEGRQYISTLGTGERRASDKCSSLRHYATSWEIAGSRPYEVNNFFFSIYLFLLAALGPGVYSASNRNEYQFLVNSF